MTKIGTRIGQKQEGARGDVKEVQTTEIETSPVCGKTILRVVVHPPQEGIPPLLYVCLSNRTGTIEIPFLSIAQADRFCLSLFDAYGDILSDFFPLFSSPLPLPPIADEEIPF